MLRPENLNTKSGSGPGGCDAFPVSVEIGCGSDLTPLLDRIQTRKPRQLAGLSIVRGALPTPLFPSVNDGVEYQTANANYSSHRSDRRSKPIPP